MIRKEVKKKIVRHFLDYVKNILLSEEDFEDIFYEITKKYLEEWNSKKKQDNQEKRKEYSKIFDYQVHVLECRKVPKKITEEIKNSKEEIIAKAISLKIPNENIAFFPVIKDLKNILDQEKKEILNRQDFWKNRERKEEEEEYKIYFVFNVFSKRRNFLDEKFDFLDEDEMFCLKIQNINYREHENAHPYYQILI